jgi:hypothetical protein
MPMNFPDLNAAFVGSKPRLGPLVGRVGGRLPKLTPHQRAEAIKMVTSGQTRAAEAARLFGVHRSNISRLLAQSAQS